MEKKYTAVITQRTPRPRSKRLREMGIGSVAGATVVTGISDSNAGAAYLPIAVFGDLFSKVVIKEAVAEETDDDGNVITPAQPAVYGIRANYDFFSIKNVSAFGFSSSEGSGSGGSVDVTQIINEGVHIATINGVNIYAPEGGGASVDVTAIVTTGTEIAKINGVSIFAPKSGASSWAELTGNPPGVLTFPNNAGYITSSALSAALSDYATKNYVAQNYVKLTDFNGYKSEVTRAISDSAEGVKNWVTDKRYGKSLGIDGQYICLLDESGNELNKVIAPYAAYTDQLGATNSTADVNIYGEVKLKNGSLAVAGNINANGNLSAAGSLSVTGESSFSASVYIGDTTNKSSKYLWFAYRGIFFEGEGSTSGNPWYGTLCTHDAYTQKSINLRCFNGWTQINQLAVGADFLSGATSPSYTLDVLGTVRASTSLKTGDCYANYLILSNNDGTYDFGHIVTPSWNSRITMTDDNGGMISFACGGEVYLDMNAPMNTAEGVVRSLRELYITHDNGLHIGNAYLRWDSTNNALYVTGADGAQINFYATGNVAGYSGLDGSVSELTNLDITGQLTAARVKANYVGSDGDLRLYAGSDSSIILNKNMTVDSDGWITTPQLNATQRIVVNSGGDIRIGSTTAAYRITDVYADGTYVYITINGKRYRFTPSSTTTV